MRSPNFNSWQRSIEDADCKLCPDQCQSNQDAEGPSDSTSWPSDVVATQDNERSGSKQKYCGSQEVPGTPGHFRRELHGDSWYPEQ